MSKRFPRVFVVGVTLAAAGCLADVPMSRNSAALDGPVVELRIEPLTSPPLSNELGEWAAALASEWPEDPLTVDEEEFAGNMSLTDLVELPSPATGSVVMLTACEGCLVAPPVEVEPTAYAGAVG